MTAAVCGLLVAICSGGCDGAGTGPQDQNTQEAHSPAQAQPPVEAPAATAPPASGEFSEQLHQAMLDEDEALAIDLVKGGASAVASDDRGVTVLHLAARSTMPDLMRLLIEQGADVHAVLPNGDTPIHWAARSGAADRPNAVETLDVLLEHGADINIANARGQRPVDYAIVADNRSWLSVLVARGAALE